MVAVLCCAGLGAPAPAPCTEACTRTRTRTRGPAPGPTRDAAGSGRRQAQRSELLVRSNVLRSAVRPRGRRRRGRRRRSCWRRGGRRAGGRAGWRLRVAAPHELRVPGRKESRGHAGRRRQHHTSPTFQPPQLCRLRASLRAPPLPSLGPCPRGGAPDDGQVGGEVVRVLIHVGDYHHLANGPQLAFATGGGHAPTTDNTRLVVSTGQECRCRRLSEQGSKTGRALRARAGAALERHRGNGHPSPHPSPHQLLSPTQAPQKTLHSARVLQCTSHLPAYSWNIRQ